MLLNNMQVLRSTDRAELERMLDKLNIQVWP